MARWVSKRAAGVHDPRHRQLIEALAQRRLAAGKTQQQLADLLGWHQSTISKIERFDRGISPIELIRIANAIECNGWRLLKQIEEAMREGGDL